MVQIEEEECGEIPGYKVVGQFPRWNLGELASTLFPFLPLFTSWSQVQVRRDKMGILSAKTITRLSVLAACGVANARVLPRDDIDTFVEKQRAISLQGVLNNIGPDGSKASGAGAGVIIASPSTDNPNCENSSTLTSIVS